MNLATCLTFIRVFISPIFLVVYMAHEALGISTMVLPYLLLFLLTVSELSDAFDGFLARKYNQVTDLGKVLDPMADSIARISVFLAFTQPPVSVPLLLVFLLIYRDSVVGTLRTICALKGYALAARPSGKLKAIIQAVAAIWILLLMIPHSMGMLTTASLHFWGTWIVGLTGFYTFFSGFDYILANRSRIQKLLISPEH